jgi:hypothetical protein
MRAHAVALMQRSNLAKRSHEHHINQFMVSKNQDLRQSWLKILCSGQNKITTCGENANAKFAIAQTDFVFDALHFGFS